MIGIVLMFVSFDNSFLGFNFASKVAIKNSCSVQKSGSDNQIAIYVNEVADDDINDDDFFKFKSNIVVSNSILMCRKYITSQYLTIPISYFQTCVMSLLITCSALGIFRL
ncbi:MAG: hypothetical protein RI955_1844 [Bacteroidota bacterium]|jgi:hypothetical protein